MRDKNSWVKRNLVRSVVYTLLGLGVVSAVAGSIANAEQAREKLGIERRVENVQSAKPQEKRDYSLDDYINAVIEIESHGNPNAERYEASINDTSYGLGQVLTGVALVLERRYPNLPRISDYSGLEENVDTKKAENMLVQLYGERVGKEKVGIDGEIDSASSALIKRVQRKHGLKADGRIDKPTYLAIQKERHLQERLCNPKINLAYTKTLFEEELDFFGDPFLAVATYNVGRDDVMDARVQQQLNDLYGAGLVTDGKIGKKTRQVVRRFQEEYKLEVDGVVGPRTYAKLQEVYMQKFPGIENPRGAVPVNRYTPNHVRKFKEALEKSK